METKGLSLCYIVKRGIRDGCLWSRLDEREQPNTTLCHTKVAWSAVGRDHDMDLVCGMYGDIKPNSKHLLLELE